MMSKYALILFAVFLLYGCAEIEPKPFEPSSGHIQSDTTPAEEAARADIPELVQKAPVLPEPGPAVELEKYTVVVNEVPVKELLFALARDAKLNVDIDPTISGVVTINAVDQTLPQILERIARQVNMRYEFDNENLLIQPDSPYYKVYRVDYINLSRETQNTNTVATSLATTSIDAGGGGAGGGGGGGGGAGGAFGGNNSTTELSSESLNEFWTTLTENILTFLDQEGAQAGESRLVKTNSESGLVTVLATANQHKQIQELIDQVMASVRRQVLIQISIVEVSLSDEYQAGIDWEALDLGDFAISSITLGGAFGATDTAAISGAEGVIAEYEGSEFRSTVQFLEEFGDVKVLSSPQLMALNNQTAILKRVQNRVFFTIDSETLQAGLGNQSTSFDTTIHQLPVGIVMTITPHIAGNGEIMLLVRPTISRTIGDGKTIPLPDNVGNVSDLGNNSVPETLTQEMESLIRLNSGQVAILGGLMEDRSNTTDRGLPGSSRLGIFGNLFKTRSLSYEKTETVIFIRPILVNDPNVDTDLQQFRPFLENTSKTPRPGVNNL